MIIKIVTLFLIVMGVLAMFGRLRFRAEEARLAEVPELRTLPDRQGPLRLREGSLTLGF